MYNGLVDVVCTNNKKNHRGKMGQRLLTKQIQKQEIHGLDFLGLPASRYPDNFNFWRRPAISRTRGCHSKGRPRVRPDLKREGLPYEDMFQSQNLGRYTANVVARMPLRHGVERHGKVRGGAAG